MTTITEPLSEKPDEPAASPTVVVTSGDHVILSITEDGLLHEAAYGRLLTVRGQLCAFAAPALVRQLRTMVDEGVTRIRVDLSDLSLCTAAGIAAFAGARVRINSLGGTLDLTGAHDIVDRVLTITRFPVLDPLSPDCAPPDRGSVATTYSG